MPRHQFDRYTETEAAVLELCGRINTGLGETVLEPCVGTGIIAATLHEILGCHVTTNDVDQNIPADYHLNACDDLWGQFLHHVTFDWIISNPPFSRANTIVQKSYRYAVHGIAMFLRLSFLEPTYDRGAFLSEHPPSCVIVLPRISFTGDGKVDSMTCAWMVWDKQDSTQRLIIVPRTRTSTPGLTD